MTNTHKQRRLTGRQEEGVDQELDGQVDYEELRVGSTTLASCEDLGSLESLTEVWGRHENFSAVSGGGHTELWSIGR